VSVYSQLERQVPTDKTKFRREDRGRGLLIFN